MKKIKLIIYSKNNPDDKFEFNSIEDLFIFINEYTVEKLIDSNYAELNYDIIVEG